MKRIFDIFVSLTGLIVLSPLFLVITMAIIILMPGSIFFKQYRVGKNGKLFKVYKFRSMRSVPEAKNGSFDAGNLSRITPLGSILRKYKFDELPQLINVFIGNMSIVGPRPEVKKWTKVYTDKWEKIHKVKPGITDNASIVFRNEEELLANSTDPNYTYENDILPQKLDIYISYVENNSFWGDISIILRTIKEVIIK